MTSSHRSVVAAAKTKRRSRTRDAERAQSPTLPSAVLRFRGTRLAHREETGEDYVEAIAQICADREGDSRVQTSGARVTELARMMGVSHVTVVRTVARLVTRGLVVTARGKPVVLTPKGERLAQRAREKHEAVLEFLLAIGVPRKQAMIDAEGIEHHVSEATIRALRRVASAKRARE